MRHLPTPISPRSAIEHRRLEAEVESLIDDVDCLRHGRQVEGTMLVLVRRAMADCARFLSREPGGRSLIRLPPDHSLAPAIAHAALADARLALAAYRRAHAFDADDLGEGEWLFPDGLAG
jgi:hypothetical protein